MFTISIYPLTVLFIPVEQDRVIDKSTNPHQLDWYDVDAYRG